MEFDAGGEGCIHHFGRGGFTHFAGERVLVSISRYIEEELKA